MLAEKWINTNAKPEIITHLKENSSKSSSSIAEGFVGFMKSGQSKSLINTMKTPYDGTSISKSRTSEDSRTELNLGKKEKKTHFKLEQKYPVL